MEIYSREGFSVKMNRTVRDFQNALETLLINQPFEKLTVDQICNEALLHRSSFYRYFHDKYDLLEQLLKQRLGTLWEQAQTEDELIESLVQYVSDHKKLFRNLTTSASRDSLYTELLRICSEILLGLREAEDDEATIVRLMKASPNPELTACTLGGGLMGILYWWQEQNYDASDAEMIEFIKQQVQRSPYVK